MRKILTAGAVAALMSGGLVFGSGIAAYASSASCATGTTPGTPSATGVTECVPTPIGTGTVSVTTANGGSGYIVADGAQGNPGPLAGYIGAEGNASGIDVVACSNGDYSTTAGDADATTAGDPDGAGNTEDANGNSILLSVSPSGGYSYAPLPPTGECAPTPPTAP